MKKILKCGSMAIAGLMFLSATASADTLNLSGGSPDMEANTLDIHYNSTTGALTVGTDASVDPTSGDSSGDISDSGGFEDFFVGTFNLSANINSSDQLDTTKTNSIEFDGVTAFGFDSSPSFIASGYTPVDLLSGTLTAVGFQSITAGATSGEEINFLFNITGGVFQNIFGPSGGIKLTVVGSATTPSFSPPDFDGSTGQSFVDAFAVPAPASISSGAVLLGILGIAGRRRLVRG